MTEKEIEKIDWEGEMADAIAHVLKEAIECGPEGAREALVALGRMRIRGYTITLLSRIREARALAQEVDVATVL